jgi:hypothetical protein
MWLLETANEITKFKRSKEKSGITLTEKSTGRVFFNGMRCVIGKCDSAVKPHAD